MSSPPVTRLLDYGQFKYEQARKEKEAKRHQRSVEFKEVRLRVKIGKGDFDTKVRRATGFLEEGDRVKVAVQFRGREVSHAYIGRDLLQRFAERVADHATVDRPPILEGRSMSMVLTSTHKPVAHSQPDQEAAKATDTRKAAPVDAEPVATPTAEPEPATTELNAVDNIETAAPAVARMATKSATTPSKKIAAPAKQASPVVDDGPDAQAATTTGG